MQLLFEQSIQLPNFPQIPELFYKELYEWFNHHKIP